ncbi:MAG: LON peptidase substrate-binding domain-containing protein [Gammaproteobacteria bacterium]|nr:LON peptidase substrate-binding domain-containing protein [Gammaproteobacteria bacterium]MCW8840333.1 LON peptidase substrate-binding domain-containing protein [Gammaproteobacteria bacterium]MCW8927969.1 LON peptidase substrate-binding domain-containing protein [Gammaproteobacteria bacterium]MCW8957745.1 LON peptidase substrate-binding domain-containing protein [Gammaproteobacteria bacterium]MCW8972978.1 LON peptidase substrate-binding domain-containing protein [Gammaproteobacteria bacterium
MHRHTIPIFPLHSVLFPGGPLALRIFEARYLDMVSRCLREESGFGVALIREGHEVGQAAEVYEVGTLGRISYWEQRKDGLLGITLKGERRFRILDSEVAENQLLVAEVELLPNPPAVPLPEKYQHLAGLLGRMLTELDQPYSSLVRELDNAEWVGARLAELLPLELVQKQRLLLEEDPLRRLERLEDHLAGQLGLR